MALPPRLDGASGHFPALSDDPSLAEESLPVLNAFRRFLESERRKARVRFLWLTLFCFLTIVATLAAAYVLWQARVNQLDQGLRSAQSAAALVAASQTNVVAEARDAASQAARDAASQAARDAASKAARDMAATAQNSIGLLREDVKSHLLAAQSNMTSEAALREGEMERLRESIAALQLENAVLIAQIKQLVKRTEEERPEPEPEEPAAPPPPPSRAAVAPAPVPEQGKVPKSEDPLTIVAPGLGRKVELRLPPGP